MNGNRDHQSQAAMFVNRTQRVRLGANCSMGGSYAPGS